MDSNPTIGTDENIHPTHKRAKQSPKIKLKEFIAEAIQIEKEKMPSETRGFAPMPPPASPAWPHWDYGTVGSDISKELGGLEELIQEITWRLNQFRYAKAITEYRRDAIRKLEAYRESSGENPYAEKKQGEVLQ